MNFNETLDNLDLPVNRAERQTILDTPMKPWVPGSSWEENRPREQLAGLKRQAKQINDVLSKREALGKIAEMIAAFKNHVEKGAEEIREFAKNNDIDCMLDFEPWDTYCIDPILESDPLNAAIKWMHSDHSC
jgi:hypothetical protein